MTPRRDAPATTWVIGSRGLLGGAVCRELARRDSPWLSSGIPWQDPAAAVEALAETAESVVDRTGCWRIIWAAGAGVIGTSQLQLDREIEVLGGFLAGLQGMLTPASVARGGLFVASSAGGVYAGSLHPPFTELTPPQPISPYGEAKLASEQLAAQLSRQSGLPVLVGRIANLYGPGQDITKPQGLISQLCRAHLTRQPLSIYVSLDTARDYLYVNDAARLVTAGLERAVQEGGYHVKILASQRPTSVAAILAELKRVTKRRPLVVLGASPNAKYQVRDLRFRSLVWPDLDVVVRTTLATGISATLESLGHDLRVGHLARR